MNGICFISRIAGALSVSTALLLSAGSGDAQGLNSDIALPFHATLQGQFNPFPIDQCTLGNQETGSGLALHLGKWTWFDNETVHFLSCPPAGSAILVAGQFTMTAANGDQIHGKVETTGTFDPTNGVAVQGVYTFVSGTGRFTNVAGSGVITVHGSASPPYDFVSSLDGTISGIGQ
jgi:hypothetical protein